MSRPISMSRSLTATEELEKLEQSITLTLQEIDQNFSKAHRIVTTNILPVVEQYGDHSRAVWDASKFWKQFFEASANVSLSGYEEANNDETSMEASDALDESSVDASHQDITTSTAADQSTYHGEESLLEDAELSGSTPRPPSTKTVKTQFSSLQSPYELMRQEMRAEEHGEGRDDPTSILESDDGGEDDSTVLFQQRTARLPDMSMTPRSLAPRSGPSAAEQGRDPLLHRMLDKTYRLRSTPHKNAPPISTQKHPVWQDSPTSSPEMTVPKLRSAAFMSPLKGLTGRQQRMGAASGPRTPGVSVQTPTVRKTKDLFGTKDTDLEERKPKYEIDWESDSDDGGLGISPPKTIQFALPPSKLLQTPAREASKRIVEDILLTAGVAPDDDTGEYSPTMVKMNNNILDDTF